MAAKQLPLYYSVTKAPNVSDPFILGSLIVDIRSRKSKHMIRNKDSLMTTVNITTKKYNNSDFFISVALIESVYSYKSKYANIENDNNKQNKTPTCIRAIGY